MAWKQSNRSVIRTSVKPASANAAISSASSSAPAIQPVIDVLPCVFRQLHAEHDVRDLHAASWLQHAPDLGNRGSLFRHEVKDAVRHNHVHTFGVDRQRRFTFAHLHVCQPARRRTVPGSIAHRLGHVDTDRAPARAYMGGRQQEIHAGTHPMSTTAAPAGSDAILCAARELDLPSA
jgi:hypothetical protein